MNRIIAVAGPIGGGKTSLARGLAGQLGQATLAFCDNYEKITLRSAQEIVRWLHEGADFNALHIPQLADHLDRLKRNQAVLDPAGNTIAPAKHIVLETNFGRAHRETGQHIDILIWIELPLEIALARKIKEYLTVAPDRAEERGRWVHAWLDNYLMFIRDLMVIQRERIRPAADLILDGQQPMQMIIQEASAAIRQKLG